MAWIVAQVVGPVIALSVGGSSSGVLTKWTWWLGAAAVMINLVWPFAVTSPPILIAFVPTFIWVAAISIALIRRPSTERPERRWLNRTRRPSDMRVGPSISSR